MVLRNKFTAISGCIKKSEWSHTSYSKVYLKSLEQK